MQLSTSQKNGIIQLAVLLVLLFCFLYFKEKISTHKFSLRLNEKEQCWIDNQKAIINEQQLKKNKVYTYYVNYLDDHKAYMIGMNISEIDRYLSHRAKGNSIHTQKEFLNVTQMSLKRFDSIKSRLRFSKFKVASKKQKAVKVSSVNSKYNLNKITVKELLSLGISKRIAFRVVNFREHLGVYTSLAQLEKVYDISVAEVKKIKAFTYLKK